MPRSGAVRTPVSPYTCSTSWCGDVVALGVGAEHQDEVLLAGLLVAHRISERRDPIADEAMLPRHRLAGGIEAGPQADAPRAAGTGRCGRRPRASTSTFTGLPTSLDSNTASIRKSMSRGPRRPKPPPINVSCSLTLLAADAERFGGAPRAPWSGSGCRTTLRRNRPRVKPRRHRSAVPSARDRRNRSRYSASNVDAAFGISARASPSLNQSVTLALGSRAVAANASRPLSLSKPQPCRPWSSSRCFQPRAVPRTPPTASRRSRRRHKAASRF